MTNLLYPKSEQTTNPHAGWRPGYMGVQIERSKSMAGIQWTTDRIKLLRDELGLTQTGLAHLLRVGQSAVSKWETGEQNPSGPVTLLLDLAYTGRGFVREMEKLNLDNPLSI